MSNWLSINSSLVNSPVVQVLEGAQVSMHSVITPARIIVNTAKQIIDTILKFYIDVNDIQAVAIQAAVAAVRAMIKELSNAPAVYMLPVSIIQTNGPAGDLGAIAGLEDMDGAATLKKILGGSGGNAGFLREVANSLNDTLDTNRPQLTRDHYVAGAFIVYGANTFAEIIELLMKLRKLFEGMGLGNALNLTNLPQPPSEGLTLSLTPPATGNNPYAVRVSWPALRVGYKLPEYDAAYDVHEIVIYRSEGPRPLKGMPGPEHIIGRFEYHGFETKYYDEAVPAAAFKSPGLRVHYYMGLGLTTVNKDGTRSTKRDPVSVIRKSKYLSPLVGPQGAGGTPPDWIKASLYDVIPQLGTAMVYVNRFLDEFEANAKGGSDQLKKFLTALTATIDRYITTIDEILAIIEALIDLLTLPEAYIGAKFFSGKGGNQRLLQELSSALTNPDDPDRPPFDKGTDAVGGLVFMAGAPSASEAQKAIALIQMLFGGVANDAMAMYNAINDAAAGVEAQICLNDALIRKICEEVETPSTTLGHGLKVATADPACSGEEE